MMLFNCDITGFQVLKHLVIDFKSPWQMGGHGTDFNQAGGKITVDRTVIKIDMGIGHRDMIGEKPPA